MEERVREAIEQVRPFLQRDGGDIELVEITPDNVVMVSLKGHCAGCPGARMTVKGLVETVVRETCPEIVAVEAV